MKIKLLSITILITILIAFSVGCTENIDKDEIDSQQQNVSIDELDNDTSQTNIEFNEHDALEMVSKEYYNGSMDNLFIDYYTNIQTGDVFVISEKIDFGSGLYTTIQAYLIKDKKIIDSLYNQEFEYNETFWDHVNKYIIKTENKKQEINDYLCKSNEDIVLYFGLNNSNKKLAICKEKNDAYIVYRFGTKDNIELEFPKKKEGSWDNFTYSYYMRPGGAGNLGLDLNYLKFENGNFIYLVYEEYYSEAKTKQVGIIVYDKTKKRESSNGTYGSFDLELEYEGTVIEGNPNSIIGSLLDLRFNPIVKVENM